MDKKKHQIPIFVLVTHSYGISTTSNIA